MKFPLSDFEQVRPETIPAARPCRGRRRNVVATLCGMAITLLRQRCAKRPFMCNTRFYNENVRIPVWSNMLLLFFASLASRPRGVRMPAIVRHKCCPYRGMHRSGHSPNRAAIF
jgi:hypothetical protein